MAISVQAQWNKANAVTTARIALVPFFVWALLTDGGSSDLWRWVALGIFVLAAGTDKVDGYLARKYDLVTDLGKLLDPIADKFLIGAALIGLSLIEVLPWWITAVILVRELGITLMRFLLLKRIVLPASRGGQAKTMIQVFAIGLFLIPLHVLPEPVTWLAWGLMIVAVVITLVTGLDYVIGAIRMNRGASGSGSGDGARPSVS